MAARNPSLAPPVSPQRADSRWRWTRSFPRPFSWPLPALATWLLAWAAWLGLRSLDWPATVAAGAAVLVSVGLAWTQATTCRRLIVAGGFPVSALALGASGAAGGLPGWAWLLPLGLLLAAYPLRAWRDAPLFPTPTGALDALSELAPLPPGARVLDAGCGLGHGLRALRRAYPQAGIEGIEWSWPLALATRLACPWARVQRGDLWAQPWTGHALVYVFQRPESMPQVWAKACAELRPDAWLASLEFAVPDVEPEAVLDTPGGRRLWLYRAPPAAVARHASAGPAHSRPPSRRR